MWDGALVPSDLHHPFENIIGYFQIVKLGQNLFKEYIPVSGMYSVVNGFLLDFFGNGKATNYYLTQNIFKLIIAIILVACLKKNFNETLVFLVSIIFYIPDYNRYFFVLPIMLLLSCRKYIDNRYLWLVTWIITSLLHGLYYPVYGVAVSAAFLPMGIYQIYMLYKSKELKELVHKKNFWIQWFLVIILVAISVPMLLGMAKHILIMSGTAEYSDSIARFGQLVTSDFIPFRNVISIAIIQAVYYVMTFITLVIPVWLGAYLIMNNMRQKNVENVLISGALIIMLMVSYTFTFLPLDSAAIFSRSWGVLLAAGVLLMKIVNNNENLMAKIGIVSIVIFVFSATSKVSLPSYNNYSNYVHAVSDEYVYVTANDAISNLGEGFIRSDIYDEIESDYQRVLLMDSNNSYFGIFSRYGHYFLLDVPGDAMIETYYTVGKKAVMEAFEVFEMNGTLIGSEIAADETYALFKAILTSGKYIYNTSEQMFYPSVAGDTYEKIITANRASHIGLEGYLLYKSADVLGQSLDYLDEVLEKVTIEYNLVKSDKGWNVKFINEINGEQADILYLEFTEMQKNKLAYLYNYYTDFFGMENGISEALMKSTYNSGIMVEINWIDEEGVKHYMLCDMERGKLLIPIGMGEGWLLNMHNNIQIRILDNGQSVNYPEINRLEFYNYNINLQEEGSVSYYER